MTRPLFFALILSVVLSGCLSVYKVEIQQGNVVTQEMVDKLKPGMTRNQVRFVLGSPLVTDIFHPDRWDYYYFLRPSKGESAESRRLTVFFKDDALASVRSEAWPASSGKTPGS